MLVLIIYSCVVIPFRIGMSVPNPTGVSQVRLAQECTHSHRSAPIHTGAHPFTPERIHSHQWTLRCSLRAPLACHVCPRLPRVPPLATCAPACRVTRVSLACHVPRVPLVQTIERCITLLFIVDLCLNFNTAYLDGSHYIIHRSLIARNYLMGWFWIDLASSIPFEDLLHLFVLLTGNEEAFSGQPPMASECL